ncbi:MAG TPA: cytochrome P450 [Oculatellaceae cyanobacterium]|jgi:cytochrome P450
MKLPASPKTHPFAQLLQWIATPLDYLDATQKIYGDCFTARFGDSPPLVMLSNPQGIQQLMTADAKQFDSGRANQILKPLVGEHSMILLDGDRHQRERQLLTPPFHGERMRAYGNLICDITDKVMSKRIIGEPFFVRAAMQEISLLTILNAVFGVNQGERFEQLKELLTSVLDSVSSPWSSGLLFFKSLQRDFGAWSPWGRFLRQKQQIDQLIYAELQDRRSQPDSSRNDILTLLMSARDEQGQPMTDEELRDELLTLLLAGHETTASALTWALYWIHSLPEVYDKLLTEISSLGESVAIPQENRSDPSILAKLPYLNAVCQETLRIYPVAILTFPRILKLPLKIMDYEFEPETAIMGCIYLTHQREDIYPEPKLFKPERFLEKQFSPYQYLPFGGSTRRCIGMAFALFEMKLALATIVSRYQLSLVDRRQPKPVRRGVTLSPSSSFQMVLNGEL